jgi:hypothetical protein
MEQEKLQLQVNFRGETTTFYLKLISIEEEQEYIKRLTTIQPGDDKKDKEYQVLVDGIVAWSYQVPTISVQEEGKLVKKPIVEGADFAEAIRTKYGQRTAANERVMNQLVVRYREAMTPDVSFLSPSEQ